MNIGFQARAHTFGRLTKPGSPVENKILGSDVQNHPIVLKRNVRRDLHRVGQVVGIDLAGAPEFVQSAALRTMNRTSADPKGGRFDGDFRAPLSVCHGGANGFGYSVLIGDAAFRPTAGNRQPIRQTTEAIALSAQITQRVRELPTSRPTASCCLPPYLTTFRLIPLP